MRKSRQIPAPPASGLRLINVPPCTIQLLFNLACWHSAQVSLGTSSSELSLGFPQPSGSPGREPHWLQSQILWGWFFWLRSPSWGAQWEAQTPRSSGGTPSVVTSLPLVGRHTGGAGSDWTVSPPLLPFSMWPFLIPLVAGNLSC